MGVVAFFSYMDLSIRSLAVWIVLVSTYCNICLAMQHPVRHAHSRHKRQHGQSPYNPTSFIIDGRGGPEYGDWGPWSEPSDCSRTCGGGVAFQTRVCRDTRPDGSSGCVGGSKRYFSCNIQDCRTSADFRAEQCEEFNRVPFENKYYDWIPYTKATNRCELNCMPKGERFYYRHKRKVIDGTRCSDDEKKDVCVDGQCLPVGCDGLLGSDAREDKCRECGGDGSSCTTVSGLLKDTDLQVGYNDILLIPAGATNIRVREIGPTNNYLAVRNQSGHYYLNGNWRIDFPRDLKFCGTTFHYERRPHGFYAPEDISALGPTTEALYIVLLYQEPNPGISFEYSVPKSVGASVDPENYVWITSEFGECSATCGGGIQEREISCVRRRDSVQVANNLCGTSLEPISSQLCAPEPCLPQWATSAWGPCSESCKKGVQERQVYCEQVIANGRPSVVNESLCESVGGKPSSKQDCNLDVVCPQWHVGPWKACDKLCGEGKQRRDVKCYKKVDGRIEVLPDSACPEAKPEAEKPCMLRPCEGVDWITTEWSGCDETCGLTQETRTAQCATQQGKIYNDSFCHAYRKPPLVRECETVKKCDFEWFAGQWSKCSSRCGAGVQTRRVFCGSFEDVNVKKVEEDKCDASLKFETEQNCTGTEVCKGDWFTGPWSQCSKPCGGGEKARKVICMLNNETTSVSNCDENLTPFSSESCNTQSCGPDEVTPVDEKTKMEDERESSEEEDPDGECEEETEPTSVSKSTSPIPSWMPDLSSTSTDDSTDDASSKSSSPDITDETDEFLTSLSTIGGSSVSSETSVSVASSSDSSQSSESATETVGEASVTEADISSSSSASTDGSSISVSLGETEESSSSVDTISDDTSAVTSSESISSSTTPASLETSDSTKVSETSTTENGGASDGASESTSDVTTDSTETSSLTEGSSEASSTSESIPSSLGSSSEPSETTTGREDASTTDLDITTESSTLSSILSSIFSLATSESTDDETTTEIKTSETDDGSTSDSASSTSDKSIVGSSTESVDISTSVSSETSSSAVSGLSTSEETLTSSSLASESTSDGSSVAFASTTESSSPGSSSVFELWGSSLSTLQDAITTKKCKRKKKPKCRKSEFGCCPDGITPAQGPFSKGCDVPETCLDSKYGCCDDGVSPAKGKDGSGCPVIPCKETLYGCCPDKVSPAEGNDFEGCEMLLPVVCTSSQFGCCPDGLTPASGPKNQGCFDCEGSGECDSCNSTKYGCCEDNLRAASGPNMEGCEEGSGFAVDCANTTYGCCPDGILAAEGPNFENCVDVEGNCTNTVFGCCPDGQTAARGENGEGCPAACASGPHGCCPDNVTPAHGPNREGCCLTTPFGCCPDNILDARGPNFEGCGCEYSPFGCCPDNATAARGPNNAGCGCQYTEHKCCPDQYTPAAGPDFQGCPCYTFQFGCCPDGVTTALGPQRLGCGCDHTQFGCCPDGKTPANGTNYGGCNCVASRFGCCPDGESEAQGEKFEGCTEVPLHPGEACKLEKDRGPGRDFTVKWFYDMEYGGCSRFWYGGREGNDNRFKSMEECKQTCVEPPGKAKCTLPKVVGPCEGYHPKWYYDTDRKQCGQFIYGGCLGNNNNFETREECQKECAADQISDVCEQPIEGGPCNGTYSRWGFNKEAKSCVEFVFGGCKANGNNFQSQSACVEQCLQPGRRKVRDECFLEKDEGPCRGAVLRWHYSYETGDCRRFLYGGCKGNANRFRSEEECLKRCRSRGKFTPPLPREEHRLRAPEKVSGDSRDSCLLPREPGICGDRIPRWYFDYAENRCMPFYFTGCGGNENQFETREACEQDCPPVIEQDVCVQPALVGECYNYTEAWYYDTIGKRCKPFYYGGCGGNKNNFPNEQACRQRCDPDLPPEQRPEARFRIEYCFEERDPGPCREFTLQWYYDRSDGVCKQFQYGGCDGNNNRFPSRSDCEQRCSAAQDACSLPQTVGPCQGRTVRWYYDSPTDSCYEFEYGGCQGNTNNFDSQLECENRCRRGPPPPPPVVATPPPPVRQPDPSDICSIGVDPGPCLDQVPSWYFNPQTLRCQAFVYGGCLGSANRFDTEEQCERQCGRFRGQDVCNLPYDSGPCAGSFRKWYYEPRYQQCLEFQYGGCEGNSNRFSSAAECETLCLHREESIPPSNDSLSHQAICNLPNDVGSCSDPAYKRWFYDARTRNCEPFLYCGFGGNLNRFKSFDTCVKFCTVPLRDRALPPLVIAPQPANDPNEIGVEQCSEARRECGQLQCPYGIEKYVDSENCERCRCHDPCRDYTCQTGFRCAVDLYRDDSRLIQARPICREVNKPGECPSLAVGSGTCSEECVSDSDCSGNSKCCNTGCGTSCVQPAVLQEATTAPPPARPRPSFPGGVAPVINVDEPNVTAEEGSYATLRCIVRGSPNPVITWRFGGNIIDGSGGRHRFLGDGSLQIIGLYRSDAGIYYCSADNGIGYPVQREFRLTVTDPKPAPAAVVAEDNTYVVVTLGAPTVLQCYAVGWPRPGVTWWRGDRTLPSSSHQYEQRRDYSLLIKAVFLRDLGPYVCQAYNGLGKAASGTVVLQAIGPVFTSNPEDEAFTQYLVNAPKAPDTPRPALPRPPVRPPPEPPTPPPIYQPPPVYEPPLPPRVLITTTPQARHYVVPVRTNISLEAKTYPVGGEVSIPCDVEGYPYPQVRWFKEESLLQPASRISISENNRLVISGLTAEDSGTYRCEASNQYGSSSSSVIIAVEGVFVHPNCTDNFFFANCDLIVRARHCSHKYYAKFCCRSCTLAGQLAP